MGINGWKRYRGIKILWKRELEDVMTNFIILLLSTVSMVKVPFIKKVYSLLSPHSLEILKSSRVFEKSSSVDHYTSITKLALPCQSGSHSKSLVIIHMHTYKHTHTHTTYFSFLSYSSPFFNKNYKCPSRQSVFSFFCC